MSNYEEKTFILYHSKIGFEFEFLSNHKIDKTVELLKTTLNRKIVIEDKAHSDFSPDAETFKVEPDNSGGSGMIELVTGPLRYTDAMIVLKQMLDWIDQNGKTNDRCSIHVNLALDSTALGSKFNLIGLNIGKFVLSFDEEKVYELFPNRKDSVYAKSIKFSYPNYDIIKKNIHNFDWTNFYFANQKYFGVNFLKLVKNYLEFRYLGGADYHKRFDDIVVLINHFIISIFDALNDPEYTQADIKELGKIVDLNKKRFDSIRSLDKFKESYPKIKLSVDLRTDEQLMKTFFYQIKPKLSNLLIKAGLVEGSINYDTDGGRIQLKDFELNHIIELHDVDIVDSKINGNLFNCDIYDCEIEDSSLDTCNIFGTSTVKESKINHCYVSRNVIVTNSYVFGQLGAFSGEMNGGIFRQGRITQHANISDKTEVIEFEKI